MVFKINKSACYLLSKFPKVSFTNLNTESPKVLQLNDFSQFKCLSNKATTTSVVKNVSQQNPVNTDTKFMKSFRTGVFGIKALISCISQIVLLTANLLFPRRSMIGSKKRVCVSNTSASYCKNSHISIGHKNNKITYIFPKASGCCFVSTEIAF